MAYPSVLLGKQGRYAATSHLYGDPEPAPEFLDQSPRRSGGPALRPDQRNWRQTDQLQILSWNPEPATRF